MPADAAGDTLPTPTGHRLRQKGPDVTTEHDLVLVVDFGAQYAQLIARRVREARVYSEIVPHTMPVAEMLARKPAGDHPLRRPVVGVRSRARPASTPPSSTAGVPVFGMCYGFQAMAQGLGGEVAPTGRSEYGRTPVEVTDAGTLLADLPGRAQGLDVPRRLGRRGPGGLRRARLHRGHPGRGVRGRRPPARRRPVAPRGAAHRARPAGARALPARHRRLPPDLDDGQHRRGADRADPRRRSATGRAICGLSGGVDSAVAAAIVQRAIGDRLTCVFVDHGLLRKGEAEQVERDFVAATGVALHVVDAEKRFLDALAGVSDPEEKRKIIGREFIRVFEAAEAEVVGDAAAQRRAGRRSWCRARSTPTSSSPAAAPAPPTSSPTTTSAACPTTSSSSWSSRCARCSRTRCGWSASSSACPPTIVWRHPFPGPGLGIRIIGEVTRERLDILREADAIAREELTARRPRPRHLAVPGRAARRRPLGRRPGRRPHLRPPGRAPPGHLRGRDDRRLGPAARTTCSRRSPPGSPTRSREVNRVTLDITASPRAPSSGSDPAQTRQKS